MTNSASSSAGPDTMRRLLDACNSASAHVSVLHVAFMGLCAYVLVIVFSTSDMNLLIGKGIRLPLVDAEVPIVGFYVTAPYLLVVVHFNLLLQLQLLSRKLYALDKTAPSTEDIGGVRDQLHIFPYTYYLIGRPSPTIRRLLSLVVAITVLLLPLTTLLTIQVRFLAYQSETITWAQRVAIWLDVACVVAVWPIIMDRDDSWHSYFHRMEAYFRSHWARTALWILVWVLFAICCFTDDVITLAFAATATGVLVGVHGCVFTAQKLWYRCRKATRYSDAKLERGAPALLVVLSLGSILPLALLAEGERIEDLATTSKSGCGYSVLALANFALLRGVDYLTFQRRREKAASISTCFTYAMPRRLYLPQAVLLAREAKPEVISKLRYVAPGRAPMESIQEEFVAQIDPIHLQGRKLRGANLTGTLLTRADLSECDLQDADLSGAHLQRANLSHAKLQGANLSRAKLQSADLSWSEAEKADLSWAQLQGAQLSRAKLQSANLRGATLVATNIAHAEFRGADLSGANLLGTFVFNTHFDGAILSGAMMQLADPAGASWTGAELSRVTFYASGRPEMRSGGGLLDLRGAAWTPIREEDMNRIESGIPEEKRADVRAALETVQGRLATAGEPTFKFESCLRDATTSTNLRCQTEYSPAQLEAFRTSLHQELLTQACADGTRMERWVNRELYMEHGYKDSPRYGLTQDLLSETDNPKCTGLNTLSKHEKAYFKFLAEDEKRYIDIVIDNERSNRGAESVQ